MLHIFLHGLSDQDHYKNASSRLDLADLSTTCDLQWGQRTCVATSESILDELDIILTAFAIGIAQASYVAFKFLGFVNSSIHITPIRGRWCDSHALFAGGNH